MGSITSRSMLARYLLGPALEMDIIVIQSSIFYESDVNNNEA